MSETTLPGLRGGTTVQTLTEKISGLKRKREWDEDDGSTAKALCKCISGDSQGSFWSDRSMFTSSYESYFNLLFDNDQAKKWRTAVACATCEALADPSMKAPLSVSTLLETMKPWATKVKEEYLARFIESEKHGAVYEQRKGDRLLQELKFLCQTGALNERELLMASAGGDAAKVKECMESTLKGARSRKELSDLAKQRNALLLPHARPLPPPLYEDTPWLGNFDVIFQDVLRVSVEDVLVTLSNLPTAALTLQVVDTGAFKSYIITQLDRGVLYSEFVWALGIANEVLAARGEQRRVAFPLKSNLLEPVPLPRTLDTLANVDDLPYVTRLEDEEIGEEITRLLAAPTYLRQKEQSDYWDTQRVLTFRNATSVHAVRRFHWTCLTPFSEFCPKGTIDDCKREHMATEACELVHFRRLIYPHTDIELGDCSYLDTCRKHSSCKFVHYQMVPSQDLIQLGTETAKDVKPGEEKPRKGPIYTSAYTVRKSDLAHGLPNAHWQNDYITGERQIKPLPIGMTSCPWTSAQWICCDVRSLDMSLLGKFDVIMADPPWDIHMELPYGTMKDEEMRKLPIECLTDDGLIFLWVTGRAMELGRECLEIWGYKIVEEIVWVKTNQLQRIIRTGRTGHWLNHSKEHCLVGIKGHPKLERGLDADVIVSEVRETSRKPDEIYAMIERCCPDGRKVEIFARNHNVHQGWLALGNQLDGVHLTEPWLLQNYNNWVAKEKAKLEAPKTPTAAKFLKNH